MTTTATAIRCDLHGLTLDVRCDDPQVAAALERRLVELPPAGDGAETLRFDYDVQPRDVAWNIGPAPLDSRLVYESRAGRVRYDDAEDVLHIEHRDGVRARCAIGEGFVEVDARCDGLLDAWLLSRPMFTLPLMELLKRRGFQPLHAAGVTTGEAAVLAVGQSGVGKSTLSYALARAGFGLLGDDLVFLDGTRVVLPFPDELDLDVTSLRLFPELARYLERADEGWTKQRLPLAAIGVRVGAPAPPRVVLFPQVASGARSRVLELDPEDALLELVPNVVLTDRASCEAQLAAYDDLVRTARCYRLHSGSDPDATAELVRELIA